MGRQTGCYPSSVTATLIAAHPNRPTVANPADITQHGVLELEYGWYRLRPEEGIFQPIFIVITILLLLLLVSSRAVGVRMIDNCLAPSADENEPPFVGGW
jgi:hypothetical protein